jgi:hypothetical protein
MVNAIPVPLFVCPHNQLRHAQFRVLWQLMFSKTVAIDNQPYPHTPLRHADRHAGNVGRMDNRRRFCFLSFILPRGKIFFQLATQFF